MDLCGEREALQGINRINEGIGKKRGAAIYNFTVWPYNESTMYRIKRGFDSIVEIKPIRGKALRGQEYYVSKVGWGGKEGKRVMFKIYRPGGIKIYIPKIVVIGPFRSGKTTFIKALSERFTSVDRLGATIAIEHGTVDYGGYRAEIFGIPGQERFSPLVEKMGLSASGIIIVIDSSKREEMEEVLRIVNNIRNKNIPYIIVANKQDLPGVMSEYEIREKVGDATVVKTVAAEGRGVFDAFKILAEKIIEEGYPDAG